MQYCLTKNPRVRFEVGTDAIGDKVTNLLDLMWILEKLKAYPIEFYVVGTGSLIQDFYQVGIFDSCNTRQCGEVLKRAGIRLKEHNSDYISNAAMQLRYDFGVDAMNVAPQFGVSQTNFILTRGMVSDSATRVLLKTWMNEVWEGGNWKKWTDNIEDQKHCVKCAGHYHFRGDNYHHLMSALGHPTEELIKNAMHIMEFYCGN